MRSISNNNLQVYRPSKTDDKRLTLLLTGSQETD